MSAPYTQEFAFPDGKGRLTAVVLDQKDFDRFCNELEKSSVSDSLISNTALTLAHLRATKLLPLMARGTQTNKFFRRWNIKTGHLAVIVRGMGDTILKQMTGEVAIRN